MDFLPLCSEEHSSRQSSMPSPLATAAAMPDSIVHPLYNDPDADIILRSTCDGVDFRLDKRTLRRRSAFFQEMFTLPDEPSQGDEPQIVDVSESATTLEDLLPFLYPVGHPEILQLDRLRAVFHAADKYDIAFLDDALKNNLRLFLPAEPLRVYAIAYMKEDAELAQAAAKCLLEHPQFAVPAHPPPEYYEIPAIAIWQAHAYRQKCVDAALEVFRDQTWILSAPHAGHAVSVSRKGNADTSGAWVWFACRSCEAGRMTLAVSNSATGRGETIRPRAWWQKYFDTVVRQLCLRPLGFVVTEPQLTRETVAQAAKCTKCGPQGALELYEYAEAMAKRIDEATSKISVELPFQEAAADPDSDTPCPYGVGGR